MGRRPDRDEGDLAGVHHRSQVRRGRVDVRLVAERGEDPQRQVVLGFPLDQEAAGGVEQLGGRPASHQVHAITIAEPAEVTVADSPDQVGRRP